METEAVRLLKLLRSGTSGRAATSGAGGGIRIIRAVTTDPNPVTFVFEGTNLALDLAIFQVPVTLYPICKGDTFFASPLIGDNTNRWGVVAKVNNGFTLATMLSPTTCQVKGIGRPYSRADLILPSLVPADGSVRPLKAGDKVSLLPIKQGGAIKYVATYCF